jgi:hypothetical protein
MWCVKWDTQCSVNSFFAVVIWYTCLDYVIFSYNLSEVLTIACFVSFEKISWNSLVTSTHVRSIQDCDLLCILRVEVGGIYTTCEEAMIKYVVSRLTLLLR